jgi:hypothetical protein
VRDQAAYDNHDAVDNLNVTQLAMSAMAVLGRVERSRAFEIRLGDIVEH